jgi:hypothetical protein
MSSSESYLFVSRDCAASKEILQVFGPSLPAYVKVVDVQHRAAAPLLKRYGVRAVPTFAIFDGNRRTINVYKRKTEVAGVLRVVCQSRRAGPMPSARNREMNMREQFANIPGIDRDGVMPTISDDSEGGICGFDGSACNNPTSDLLSDYAKPLSPINSMAAALNGGPGFQPEMLAQQYLVPQHSRERGEKPVSEAALPPVKSEDMAAMLQRLESQREQYDKRLQNQNESMYQHAMTTRP